jgi:hypothetical protein
MDQNIKQKWIKALRSGDYKQGHRALYCIFNNEETYCCLGVLCIIQGVTPEELHRLPDGIITTEIGEYAAGLTPAECETLGSMNDGTPTTKPRSFEKIADYIERAI